jgi:adenylate cyclase
MLSERLLRTILPQHVARQLLRHIPAQELVETYKCASVAFVNLESAFYKKLVTRKSPAEIISQLDDIFSYFDDILAQPQYLNKVYKLETIGQTYLLMTPYPKAQENRAVAEDDASLLCRCVLDIKFACEHAFETTLPVRIGINSGPVVAGVIGRSRLFFRVFGDAVNGKPKVPSTARCVFSKLMADCSCLEDDEPR